MFLGRVVSRRKARNRERIDSERSELGPLPGRRSDGFQETLVRVTSTGGFSLRRVFYTVLSRLVVYTGTRDAYRPAFEGLREGLDDREACRRMVRIPTDFDHRFRLIPITLE